MNIIKSALLWDGILYTRQTTTKIILHHSVGNGSIYDIHNVHLGKGWKGVAYHFYVRKDGSVYEGRPIDKIGGHTMGYNNTSVGICFEGNFENETMSEPQKKSGRQLVSFVKEKYPNAEVIKHSDVNATACPGTNFPFTYIEGSLEENDAINAEDDEPSEWAAESWTWCHKNGIFDSGNPHGNVTREMFAVVIKRLYDMGGIKNG